MMLGGLEAKVLHLCVCVCVFVCAFVRLKIDRLCCYEGVDEKKNTKSQFLEKKVTACLILKTETSQVN